jgi:SAM-dependent methyltransferase
VSHLLRKKTESYDGRNIGCAPGTHAALAKIIGKHVSERRSVLDIGAHSGALLLRLRDLGFSDLTGVDLDPTRFDVPNSVFKQLDLNSSFANQFHRKFQIITATDVIEHLDSPRNFLAEAHKLIEDGGLIAITLPNVASWQGRLKFLLRGELWGFGEKNYRAQRHISPITFEQMSMMLSEIGFHLIESGAAGSFSTPLMSLLTLPLWVPVSLFGGGAPSLGECAIFVAQKVEADADLKVPTHYRDRWKGVPDRIGLGD